jgi:hypothetical protein
MRRSNMDGGAEVRMMRGKKSHPTQCPPEVAAPPDSARTEPGGKPEFGAQDPVTQGLRSLFSSVQEEGVPDRFRDLLDTLAKQERNE